MLLILYTQKAGTNSINFLAKQFNVLILFQSTEKKFGHAKLVDVSNLLGNN